MQTMRMIAAYALCSFASTIAVLVFSTAIDALSALFQQCVWLAWALPVAGIATYGLYRLLKIDFSTNTSLVVQDVVAGERVGIALAPSIFAGTCLSIACGGSVGKEAAALQMGAAFSSSLGSRLGLRGAWEQRVLVMCGMSAALSVLLGTPLAAVAFSFELFRRWEHAAAELAALVLSSLAAFACAQVLGVGSLRFAVEVPQLGADVALFAAAVAVAGAAAGALFCLCIRWGKKLTSSLRPAVPLVAGGLVCSVALFATGCYDYSGTGMAQLAGAFAAPADGADFFWKLLFTAFLLGCGFKGGEIMPSLCIGALLGSFVGALFGVDCAFAAALGLVGVFATCTNCPLSAFLLGLEAFGISAGSWYALVVVITFVLTSRVGLYGNTGTLRDYVRFMSRRAKPTVRTPHDK